MLKLNDIKISQKIMGGFIILLVITAIIGFVGFNSLNNAGERVKKFEASAELSKLGMQIRGEAKNFIIVGDDYYGGRDKTVMVYYDEKKDEITARIDSTKAMFKRQQDIDEIEHLREVFHEYDAAMQDYFEKYAAQEKAINNMDTVAGKLLEVVNNLIEDQGDKLENEISRGANTAQLRSRDQLLKESNFIIDHVNAMRIHAKNIVLGRLDEAADWRAELQEAERWAGTVKSKFNDQYNIDQANKIMAELEAYRSAGENYIKAEEDLAEALAHAGETGEEFDSITEALKESQNKAMNDEHAAAITMLITFAIIAVIIGILLALFITKLITKPVNKIAKEAKELAKTGDLSKRATVMGKDEIGEMAEAINLMLDNTAGPVEELADKSEKIAAGDLTVDVNIEANGDITKLIASFKKMVANLKQFVGNVSKNANIAATSAEELSASAEEVNASTQQVSSTIQEIAKGGQNLTRTSANTKEVVAEVDKAAKVVAQNAQRAAEGAANAGKAADEGTEAGKKAGTVMQQILESSKATAQNISSLDEKSKEIGKIIDVINNISEQTNLLALNAAIEAARAGEAGRGFAVVADEVRKLAEESQKATTQIADMITSIQEGTKRSVEDMTKSSKVVEEGGTVVQQALQSLEEIARISKEVGQQAQEVSAAAQQASAGVDKTSKAIEEVSSVAEESAASTEEVSASMEETTSSMQQVSGAAQNLAKGADELRQLVSKFKVDESVKEEIKAELEQHKKDAKKPKDEPKKDQAK